MGNYIHVNMRRIRYGKEKVYTVLAQPRLFVEPVEVEVKGREVFNIIETLNPKLLWEGDVRDKEVPFYPRLVVYKSPLFNQHSREDDYGKATGEQSKDHWRVADLETGIPIDISTLRNVVGFHPARKYWHRRGESVEAVLRVFEYMRQEYPERFRAMKSTLEKTAILNNL